jgi:peptidoglycan/xylan/chitin deacetylase (PgdA/CDA1 family)
MLAAVNHHYIRRNFNNKYPSIFGTTPSLFEKKLLKLASIGTFVSQYEIVNALESGMPLPDSSILITFDDGLSEQFDLALPILLKHKIPAVFFISSTTLEKKSILNVHKIHIIRSEIDPVKILNGLKSFNYLNNLNLDFSKARKSGMEHYKYDMPEVAGLKYILNFVLSKKDQNSFIDTLFEESFPGREEEICDSLYMNQSQIKILGNLGYVGSHGHDHDPIARLNLLDQITQVEKSKSIIKKVSGQEIYSFSYPYGSFDACDNMSSILDKAGYKMAFTMERAINSNLENPFYFSRFDNNDMPLGKSYPHSNPNIFQTLPKNEWQFSN